MGLTETRRHRPLNATFDTREELFLGTCDSRGIGGVGVLNRNSVNTNLVMNIDSFEQLGTKIWINAGHDNLRRLRSNIQLLLRGNRDLLYGLGDVLQGRSHFLQGHRSAKKPEGSRATKRRLSCETLELIHQRGAATAAGNCQLTSELATVQRSDKGRS
ncbi:hypothetical protein ANCDUO_10944 [Ancylostoma duodenale]|uniref:Uncharacterized protein n=1 Tax=Ancylostoma duodenale TaxID=51022 RepID=A0A0C2GCN0_9BILA|nr:hypothetical protein ANCDUO_10944 [Ancylostoma duodenale]